MKLSAIIEKTAETKAAAKAASVKNGYKTILNILEKDVREAEFLPGGLLKLVVNAVVGDEFDRALKDIGNDTLNVGWKKLWRATTSRGIIYCEGLDPKNVDEGWEEILDFIKEKVEDL